MIKATVRYSGDHFWALHRQFRKINFVSLFIYFFQFCYIIFLINYMIKLSEFTDTHKVARRYMAIMALLGALIALELIGGIIRRIMKIKKIRSQKPVDELRYFIFDDEAFTMQIEGKSTRSLLRLKYEGIPKEVEGEDYVFVFIDTRACIIGKHELTEGNPLELLKLLEEKLGDRFKRGAL